MALTPAGERLLAAVWEELERGRIEERRIVHDKDRELVDGLMEGQTVTINPIPSTIDTLIHELFHRRYPHWGESYVRARTKQLTRCMTSEEELALWKAYQARVKRKKRRKVVE